MKKGLIGILSVLLLTVMAGCGGESGTAPEAESEAPAAVAPAEGSGTVAEEAPAEEAPAEEAPAEEAPAEAMTEEAPAEAAPAEEAPAEEMKEEAPAEAAAVVDGLVGSKWVYEEIALEFKDGNKVFLKGGPLAALAPDGTDADYKLDGDKFEVNVLGQTYTGTFDGAKLMVDGKEAVKQQ